MTEIISREEAKARGLKRYFTGKPCKHGHVAERNFNTRSCLECDRRNKSSLLNVLREEINSRRRIMHKARVAKNPLVFTEKNRIANRKQRLNNPDKARKQSNARMKRSYERKAEHKAFMESLAKEEFERLRQRREAELEKARLEAEHDAYMAALEAGLKD